MILKVDYEVFDDHVDLCPAADSTRVYRLEDLHDQLLLRFEAVPFNAPVGIHTDDFGEIAEWYFHKGELELTCTLNQLNQILKNKFKFKNEG